MPLKKSPTTYSRSKASGSTSVHSSLRNGGTVGSSIGLPPSTHRPSQTTIDSSPRNDHGAEVPMDRKEQPASVAVPTVEPIVTLPISDTAAMPAPLSVIATDSPMRIPDAIKDSTPTSDTIMDSTLILDTTASGSTKIFGTTADSTAISSNTVSSSIHASSTIIAVSAPHLPAIAFRVAPLSRATMASSMPGTSPAPLLGDPQPKDFFPNCKHSPGTCRRQVKDARIKARLEENAKKRIDCISQSNVNKEGVHKRKADDRQRRATHDSQESEHDSDDQHKNHYIDQDNKQGQ
ncbi:hypothetical protein CPB97_003172 [Podila verticillata]|nr:hypothetical protein CPB97_003172 [Podila verticillata]